MHFTNLTLKIG